MKIKISNISKKFSDTYALQNINLNFDSGRFYGILGPNGAGKSTLINIIIGNISSSEGNCEWFDDGANKLSQLEVKNSLGVVFQDNRLDPLLTVYENFIVRGKMYGMSRKSINIKVKELNQYINIESILKRRYSDLSGGQKRKCEVIRALLHSPEVLILDEPTTGLDPQTRAGMWEAITKIQRESGITVVLVTHYLEEMDNCDQISVLLGGKIQYTGSVSLFIKEHSKTKLLIQLDDIGNLNKFENELNVDYRKDLQRGSLTLLTGNTSEMIDNLYKINKLSRIKEFQVCYATLEKAYLNLLKGKGFSFQEGAE